MKVLLIYPEFPDTFWSFKHALKFIRKRASLPPLGLLTVASMLPAAWEIRLVDLNIRKLREKDLAWADWAMISGMTIQRDSARRLIARCKRAGLTVAAGGPLFTAEHGSFEEVDHFILNEAEYTLPRFLNDLEAGCAKRLYDTHAFADIRESPAPAWELADLKQYATMSIQYSRGCPYHCEFCNVTTLFGHRPRIKTPEQVIAELDALYERGWRGSVFFVDDNLIGNKRAIKSELLPALIKWRRDKHGITFHTEASINLADDETLMRMMADAGFDTVFIGIETPSEESLAECQKSQNEGRDLVRDVKRIQRAGLQVQGGFIVGFDSDPPSIFQRQIDFIQKSGIVTAMVGLLQALPGTKLHDRMKKEGRLLGLTTGDNVDGSTNIATRMEIDELHRGYKRILRHIYEPKHYYERVRNFLRDFEAPKVTTPLRWSDLMAFGRSLFRLGIVGKERSHYWRLLFWTRLRRPELFPLAVTLAIYGHHFRRVCELHVL